MTNFIFNDLTESDIQKYVESSNVFNMSKDSIEKDKITITYFEDEKLGASEEKLDVAVYNKDSSKWDLLDITDKIKDYTEIPVGYLLEGVDYSRVLIIVRRMSNMVLDRVRDSVSSYIYCRVSGKYKDIENDKPLFGLLAKSHVFLDTDEEDIKKQIQSNIVNRNEEICSRLFD